MGMWVERYNTTNVGRACVNTEFFLNTYPTRRRIGKHKTVVQEKPRRGNPTTFRLIARWFTFFFFRSMKAIPLHESEHKYSKGFRSDDRGYINKTHNKARDIMAAFYSRNYDDIRLLQLEWTESNIYAHLCVF